MEQMYEEKVIEAERKFAADVAAKKKKDPKYDAESDKVRSFLALQVQKYKYWLRRKERDPKYDALRCSTRYAVY